MPTDDMRIKPVVELFKKLAELPIPDSAHIAIGKAVTVSTTFAQSNHATFEKEASAQTFSLARSDLSLLSTSTPAPIGSDILHRSLSPSGRFSALFRKGKDGKGLRIQLYENAYKLAEASLPASRFVAVYTNTSFGQPSWSKSEDLLAMTIEEEADAEADPSAKFEFRPMYGETMDGRKRAAVYVARFIAAEDGRRTNTFNLHRITDVNSSRQIAFGQPIFAPDATAKSQQVTLFTTGYTLLRDDSQLGLIYCTNRDSAVFRFEVTLPAPKTDDETAEKTKGVPESLVKADQAVRVTPKGIGAWSPRISPDSKLVYLSARIGPSHDSCLSLHVVPLDATVDSDHKPTVPVVHEPTEATGGFPGLWLNQLAQWPFIGRYVILSSFWGSRVATIAIDLSDRKLYRLTGQDDDPTGSTTFLAAASSDDKHGYIVATRANVASPPELVISAFDGDKPGVSWTRLFKIELPIKATARTEIKSVPGHEPSELLLVTPQEVRGVVTYPHGGPHGVIATTFSPAVASLILGAGIAFAASNFPGSTGFGQKTIDDLVQPGAVGKLDIEAIVATTELALIELRQAGHDPVSVYAGGSHSGFTGAHLTVRYPDLYKAIVLRNPVVDIVGMYTTTDIQDWCYGELGLGDFPRTPDDPAPERAVTPEAFKVMHDVSPTTYLRKLAKDVKLPPTLLLVGDADHQGKHWYHALKGRGADVLMLVFPGEGHPLAGVEAQLRGFEAQLKLFERAIEGGS